MAFSLVIPAAVLGACAAAIVFSPVAGADTPLPGCDRGSGCARPDSGPKPKAAVKPPRPRAVSDVPAGWVNESLWARPGPSGLSPIGSGPKPPIIATKNRGNEPRR